MDGLVVLLNELASMLGSGCLTLIGEDSKPFNSDLFCTGAGAGDVPEVKRSEQVSMASRVNCVEELMTVLGDAASESVMPTTTKTAFCPGSIWPFVPVLEPGFGRRDKSAGGFCPGW